MNLRQLLTTLGIYLLLGCCLAIPVSAQDDAPATDDAAPAVDDAAADDEEPKVPEIAEEPKTIDPASLLPEPLAKKATVDLSESSLRELVDWLEQEQDLVVLVEWNNLSDIGITPGEPISDTLDDAPLYLLLNRLSSLHVAWYYEDEIVYLTSVGIANERLTTVPYNVSDLLDAGYHPDSLAEMIQSVITPTNWDEVGGVGALSFLGDVMLVSQTEAAQLEIKGLLEAIRNPGRRTFISDPPQHVALRERLEENVSVDFSDTPLETAVAELAAAADADIRLDRASLREMRIRERQPVTLRLNERKLETVLQALLLDFDLTWVLRDGVIWITSKENAESLTKTAVYDVRDLCRDEDEADALYDAITSQTAQITWAEVGGNGDLVFPRPGTLVVSNQESVLNSVLDLLETYRTSLRLSKPRVDEDAVDPLEVITVYYRLHENVATDLQTRLPLLVRPETWRNEDHPEAVGTILQVSSAPEVSNAGAEAPSNLVADRAVLVIEQTREVHDEIANVLVRVQSGDVWQHRGPMALGGGAGGGFGGGGSFGGGYFSVPDDQP